MLSIFAKNFIVKEKIRNNKFNYFWTNRNHNVEVPKKFSFSKVANKKKVKIASNEWKNLVISMVENLFFDLSK